MDSLILDYWNGRPTVWMSTSSNGDPYLHWMVFGHTEDFEVWLHVRLTWPIADKFTRSVPLRLDEALRFAPGAPVRIVLSEDGRPVMLTDANVPPAPAGGVLAEVMTPFIEAIRSALRASDPDEVLMKTAVRDVVELLSA